MNELETRKTSVFLDEHCSVPQIPVRLPAIRSDRHWCRGSEPGRVQTGTNELTRCVASDILCTRRPATLTASAQTDEFSRASSKRGLQIHQSHHEHVARGSHSGDGGSTNANNTFHHNNVYVPVRLVMDGRAAILFSTVS